jgi:hypothetical protein
MTDMLIFLGVNGQRLYTAGWTGEWPPPERLLVMRGGQSGQIAVVEEDRAPVDYIAAARELGTIEETRFKLRNASTIAEPAPEGAHWFRGAEYVPETDDA